LVREISLVSRNNETCFVSWFAKHETKRVSLEALFTLITQLEFENELFSFPTGILLIYEQTKILLILTIILCYNSRQSFYFTIYKIGECSSTVLSHCTSCFSQKCMLIFLNATIRITTQLQICKMRSADLPEPAATCQQNSCTVCVAAVHCIHRPSH
jgi:hypothetical protein